MGQRIHRGILQNSSQVTDWKREIQEKSESASVGAETGAEGVSENPAVVWAQILCTVLHFRHERAEQGIILNDAGTIPNSF